MSGTTTSSSSDVLPDWPKGSQIKDYTGGCHCKKVRFEFAHPAFDKGQMKVMSCNCSICNQHGLLHIYTPDSRFAFIQGRLEELGSYRLPNRPSTHHFCLNCGSNVLVSNPGEFAVNVRAVDGVDVKRLDLTHFDGRNLL